MAEKFKRGELTKKILLGIAIVAAAGATAAILATFPGLGMVGKQFFEWYRGQDRERRYRIRKTFERLRRERLIAITEEHGITKVVLTEHGKRRILQYRFEGLVIPPMKKWDGVWRMVIFDIPEHLKKGREALREKLRKLQFYPLQKSVWIHPHECRNEIDFILEFFNISTFTRIAEVCTFDGDELVKNGFRERGIRI